MSYTLITGATSDIGIQICKTLEESGHSLLMTDLEQEALEEVKNGLRNPSQHQVLALDLSSVEQSKEVLTSFVKENEINVSGAVFAAGIFAVKPLRMIDYNFLKFQLIY